MTNKYLVAVSGGVDSVALLHMLASRPGLDIVVAHFDHGIREDSSSDAEFVAELAKGCGLQFESRREELGVNASEELARDRRYRFLCEMADKHGAQIVTAHHADDAIETVAINLRRGTGWRGLSVMDSEILRPLLLISKEQLLAYAKKNSLEWREDSTNASDKYMRNRIRRDNKLSDDDKLQVLALRAHQIGLKNEIDREIASLIGDGPEYSRYFFTHIDSAVAMECLRHITRARLTRPQLSRALVAVKTYKPGSVYEAGSGVELKFTSRNFTIELIK